MTLGEFWLSIRARHRCRDKAARELVVQSAKPVDPKHDAVRSDGRDHYSQLEQGQPFAGALAFGPPSSKAGGVFAIGGSSLIINPSGSGVGGTVEQVTIVATR